MPRFHKVQALYVCIDPLAITSRMRISALAMGARLPTMFAGREFVEAGGLISYGPDFADARLLASSAAATAQTLR
jgi:putative ABC transport system substrate-binding protein